MKKNHFYKTGVDICSVKSMFNFINNHFKYWTMNSWNRLESIANNVKLYNLGLDGDWGTALDFLYDEDDCGDLQYQLRELVRDWERKHPGYTIGYNGRSDGYLVIYNHDKERGTVNFRNILPEYLTGYDTYEEWKESIRDSWYGSRDYVSNYTRELREYTELIRDFDRLCDDMRSVVNEYSQMDYEAQKRAYEAENGEI